MNQTPNKPDAANLAVAPLFHAGRQWRGVADPGRSMHKTQGALHDKTIYSWKKIAMLGFGF